MMQAYTHILTILFKHRYFSDDLFKSIDVSFADGTQKLIRDLGIIVKSFAGGLHLLASNPELLNSENDNDVIQLHLNCNDPNYINYTELPLYRLNDKLLYFNNLSFIPDSKSESYFLHSEEFIGQNEIVQLSNGKINVSRFNADMDYDFTDASGNEISAQCITQSVQESDKFVISNLPQGLVLFNQYNSEIERFYYYPKAVWRKPLGIFEIFSNSLFKHYTEKGKVEYALNFNHRETIWKYFLVSPVYQKFNNLSIINKAKEEIFNPPQKLRVDNNSEALVFESKNKIPLSEISDYNLQLVDNYEPGNGKGKVILKNLPKASPEQLFSDNTSSAETIYSHIYI